MAQPRTRTLGPYPCVGPITSSRNGHELSNVVFISCYILKLVRTKIWDDWTLLSWAPVLRFLIFYIFFFTKSQKKIIFFLFWLKISLHLFLVRLEKIIFLPALGGFFDKFFGNFSKYLIFFLMNFSIIFDEFFQQFLMIFFNKFFMNFFTNFWRFF